MVANFVQHEDAYRARVIGLCGAAGAGKDTVADMLPGFTKLAFADLLYREVAAAHSVTVEWLKDRSRKETPQPELAEQNCMLFSFGKFCHPWPEGFLEWSQEPRTPRHVLQRWGDYRRSQDPDYFVKRTIAEMGWGGSYVLSDVRFANEAAAVRAAGGELWQIVRPGYSAGATGHKSDTDGSEFKPDRVVHNSSDLHTLLCYIKSAL